MAGKRIVIVGATGIVGQKVIDVLFERDFPISDIRALASARSKGQTMRIRGNTLTIEEVTPEAFRGADYCFFAIGTGISKELAPLAAREGAIVIDKSNAFRMDPSVPLVVPEVNKEDLRGHKGIIASPNCSTIQMVLALKPLHDCAGIRRVVVSTYQSVSGSGKEAVVELQEQVQAIAGGKEITPKLYPHQIAFNLVPEIDVFMEDAYTGEEWKMVSETRKILHEPQLQVSATCVRVPVYVSHSESILIETEKHLSPDEVREILRSAPSVEVIDGSTPGVYPTPLQAEGSDKVYVGRIRRDLSSENGIWLWVVSDNLRKGAATNAVQIAEATLDLARECGR